MTLATSTPRTAKSTPKPAAKGASKGRSRSIYDVAVLQKALDLLEVLADEPDLGLSELSEKTGAS